LNKSITIGILSIQGDVEENVSAVQQSMDELNIEGNVIPIKDMSKIDMLDGLVIPGGESTVIGTLLFLDESQKEILRNKILNGLPVLGTCAGLIFLSKRAYDKRLGDTKQHLLELLDVTVERNAFGRQYESFENQLSVPAIGDDLFKGVFIRGPVITETGNDVEVLCRLEEKIVAVQQKNILATSFHPELADDYRFHKKLIELCLSYNESKSM
jgi:5'-phosphate synthase pdxT subunit